LPVPSPDEKDARGISEAYWCDEPGCKRWFDTKVGRTNHRRFVHGIHESNITRHRSENSIKIDGQIKKLYPEKSPAEIADILKISYPSVAARINKMHKEGEIKEYLGQRTIQSCPPKANEPARPEVAPVATLEIESISKSNSFNVGQLLKVNSENQVAIVNATLEVIDERGSEYEVTLRRTNRGLGVILNSQMLAQLIDTLKYRVEEINDVSEDAQRDDPDWFQDLMEEQYVCESIIDKIRKDARIPEEKETNEAKE
jgi:DNA-binding Lrp family transcriptional regulator